MLVRPHLLVLALVLAVLPAYSDQFYANRYGKRQEFAGGQQAGFQSGSRFGRDGRTDPDVGQDERLQRRFYANGRYGKRAGNSMAEYQYLDDGDSTDCVSTDFSSTPFVVDEDSQVFCRYTGVTNLFRCAHRKEGDDIPAFLQDSASNAVTGNPLN